MSCHGEEKKGGKDNGWELCFKDTHRRAKNKNKKLRQMAH